MSCSVPVRKCDRVIAADAAFVRSMTFAKIDSIGSVIISANSSNRPSEKQRARSCDRPHRARRLPLSGSLLSTNRQENRSCSAPRCAWLILESRATGDGPRPCAFPEPYIATAALAGHALSDRSESRASSSHSRSSSHRTRRGASYSCRSAPMTTTITRRSSAGPAPAVDPHVRAVFSIMTTRFPRVELGLILRIYARTRRG